MPPEPVYPLTVSQYYELLNADLLPNQGECELLEGWIYPKMTHKPAHDVIVSLLDDVLSPLLPAGWCPRTEKTAQFDDSVPEPDGVIARGIKRDYLHRHPDPKDIGLVLEVADTTVAHDRRVKNRVYARALIPTYWIINLRDHQVEVYSRPVRGLIRCVYRNRQDYEAEDLIPLVLDGKQVGIGAARELLP
jgi:Uma2 family endonuclease